MELARKLKLLYSEAFPGFSHKDTSKRITSCLKASLRKFRTKRFELNQSGNTGPPDTETDDLCSRIISLNDSLRVNNTVGQTAISVQEQGSNVTTRYILFSN